MYVITPVPYYMTTVLSLYLSLPVIDEFFQSLWHWSRWLHQDFLRWIDNPSLWSENLRDAVGSFWIHSSSRMQSQFLLLCTQCNTQFSQNLTTAKSKKKQIPTSLRHRSIGIMGQNWVGFHLFKTVFTFTINSS